MHVLMAVRVWVACLLLIGLLGWRKEQGDRWAIATDVLKLETPCPLPASFPLILPPFSGAMELGKYFGEGRIIGDQDNRIVPVLYCMSQAAL